VLLMIWVKRPSQESNLSDSQVARHNDAQLECLEEEIHPGLCRASEKDRERSRDPTQDYKVCPFINIIAFSQ